MFIKWKGFKLAGVVLGLALLVGVALPAEAQTTTLDQLRQQIAALQTQLAALVNGNVSVPTTNFTFTRDLTIGSRGTDVTALQQWLIARGVSISAGATGYFGTQTQAALRSYQASVGISPASGYFGPITRAHIASMTPITPPPGGGNLPPGCVSTVGYSPVTGQRCDSGSTLPPGCTSTVGYSPVTGQRCDSEDDGDDTDRELSGGAGSIDSFDELSGFSNEQVGEGEEDVEIAGIEIEVDEGSDIELMAVRIDFSTQPSNDDLDEFVDEVSIWLDGEEYARVDAHEFNDDNNWTKTVTLDSGAIIRRGETGELTVAVSGVNNVDSDDAGDDWGLDFLSVRFADASGAIITETANTNEFLWSVTTFATAADVELRVQSSDDTPEGVVNIDDTSDTNGVELLRFSLRAEGSDIEVKDLPITFTVGSGNTADTLAKIASTVTLEIDGEEVGSENASGVSSSVLTFDDVDFMIGEGDTVEVVVRADINDTEAGSFVDGDQLTVSFTSANRNAADLEDETGEDLPTNSRTGTATGEALAFYDTGINVSFVSASETLVAGADGTADDDTITLRLVFDVEAFDGTVYVSNEATPTTAALGEVTSIDVANGGILYRYEIDSTATTALLADVISRSNLTGNVTSDSNEYMFEDGERARLTLTVTRTNNSAYADSDGFHQMQLVAIGWSTTPDDSTMNVYDFDLEDFDTDPIFAN
jgi:hypothetical protein